MHALTSGLTSEECWIIIQHMTLEFQPNLYMLKKLKLIHQVNSNKQEGK